jgi:hypothetical protein
MRFHEAAMLLRFERRNFDFFRWHTQIHPRREIGDTFEKMSGIAGKTKAVFFFFFFFFFQQHFSGSPCPSCVSSPLNTTDQRSAAATLCHSWHTLQSQCRRHETQSRSTSRCSCGDCAFQSFSLAIQSLNRQRHSWALRLHSHSFLTESRIFPTFFTRNTVHSAESSFHKPVAYLLEAVAVVVVRIVARTSAAAQQKCRQAAPAAVVAAPHTSCQVAAVDKLAGDKLVVVGTMAAVASATVAEPGPDTGCRGRWAQPAPTMLPM